MPPPTRADGSGSEVLGCPDRFGKALRRMRQRRPQAVSNDLLGLSHDPVDQLFPGRDVVDKADDHATGPPARIHVALAHVPKEPSRDGRCSWSLISDHRRPSARDN
jgi:hypothetical protein